MIAAFPSGCLWAMTTPETSPLYSPLEFRKPLRSGRFSDLRNVYVSTGSEWLLNQRLVIWLIWAQLGRLQAEGRATTLPINPAISG